MHVRRIPKFLIDLFTQVVTSMYTVVIEKLVHNSSLSTCNLFSHYMRKSRFSAVNVWKMIGHKFADQIVLECHDHVLAIQYH